jgi:hypothetical protein
MYKIFSKNNDNFPFIYYKTIAISERLVHLCTNSRCIKIFQSIKSMSTVICLLSNTLLILFKNLVIESNPHMFDFVKDKLKKKQAREQNNSMSCKKWKFESVITLFQYGSHEYTSNLHRRITI